MPDSKIHTCVSCGAHYSGQNHKCSDAHEAAKRGAQTRAINDEVFYAEVEYVEREPSIRARLSDGFAMLGDF